MKAKFCYISHPCFETSNDFIKIKGNITSWVLVKFNFSLWSSPYLLVIIQNRKLVLKKLALKFIKDIVQWNFETPGPQRWSYHLKVGQTVSLSTSVASSKINLVIIRKLLVDHLRIRAFTHKSAHTRKISINRVLRIKNLEAHSNFQPHDMEINWPKQYIIHLSNSWISILINGLVTVSFNWLSIYYWNTHDVEHSS